MNLKVTVTEEQITTLETAISIIKNCNPYFYKSCIFDDFCVKSLFIDIYKYMYNFRFLHKDQLMTLSVMMTELKIGLSS